MDCVIDIETYQDITDQHMHKWEAGVKPDGRLKDQEKITADIEKKRMDYIERAALSAVTGKIVAAAVGQMDNGTIAVKASREEREVIVWLDDLLGNLAPTTIVTYNGRRFDLPYLIARYAKNEYEPRYPWPVGHSTNHVDLYDTLGGGSLEDWAITFFGRTKTSQGNEIAAMYVAHDMTGIEQHCKEDVSLTMDIWSRVKRCISPGGRGGRQVW